MELPTHRADRHVDITRGNRGLDVVKMPHEDVARGRAREHELRAELRARVFDVSKQCDGERLDRTFGGTLSILFRHVACVDRLGHFAIPVVARHDQIRVDEQRVNDSPIG